MASKQRQEPTAEEIAMQAPLFPEGLPVEETSMPAPLASPMVGVVKFKVPQNATVAEYADVFEDIDDIRETSSKFKMLRLAQGMTKEVAEDGLAKAGDWVLEGYDAVRQAIFMPISYETSRALYVPNPEDPKAPNIRQCSSQRRVMRRTEPALTGVGTPGGDCGSCPMSQWQNSTTGGSNRPPACTLTHILIGVSLTHECRVEVHFRKNAERSANDMLTMLRTRGWGNCVFELHQEVARNKANQTFWVPKARVVEVTPAMISAGVEIARRERESMGY